jgi:hypothetical protein
MPILLTRAGYFDEALPMKEETMRPVSTLRSSLSWETPNEVVDGMTSLVALDFALPHASCPFCTDRLYLSIL